ncbi:MAG TPA: 30S ribosome-binding factor RbfA [Candidatus Saccharimonadaceae bacterium]|jgi:ribosome-binding factor A|nr:30S ribosome-binding factor RbfA [Candidatus Saccharimonadaceae bacterium]
MRIRPERVAHLMRREIADILQNKLRDPRLSTMVSVTDVEVTHDLSSAKVYVSMLAEGPDRDRSMHTLQSAAGYVRRELGPRLGLREVPELRFEIDTSIERGARVDEILRRLHDGEVIEDDEGEAP